MTFFKDFGYVKSNDTIGFLPNEIPPWYKLLLFSLQQFLVMIPATVLAAMLMGFHVSTTIFASGIASLFFVFFTKGKIPLYYGSSFSYIAAVISVTGTKVFGEAAPDLLLGQAQFGIIMSGIISIIAGIIALKFGRDKIENVLPPSVTGSITMIIGISLMGVALLNASGNWLVAFVALLVTIICSIFLKGFLGQLPILIGIIAGYIVAIPFNLIDFTPVAATAFFEIPHFTFPVWNAAAVFAIMPIALATLPESTSHLFQIDLYVNKLHQEKMSTMKLQGKTPDETVKYKIADKLGLNLIGDGLCDMISSFLGGPAGTNYGENISAMSITKVFSTIVLIGTAVLAIVFSFFGKFSAVINSIPAAAMGGVSIYLFGTIAAQGVALMIDRKVDLFNNKNIAIIATTLVIGIGGTFGFANGMIPIFGIQLPAIATASVWAILLNFVLKLKKN
jgi:uracil permease